MSWDLRPDQARPAMPLVLSAGPKAKCKVRLPKWREEKCFLFANQPRSQHSRQQVKCKLNQQLNFQNAKHTGSPEQLRCKLAL